MQALVTEGLALSPGYNSKVSYSLMSERLFPLRLTFESYSPSSFNVLFLWIGGREHSLKGCQRQIITLLPLVSHPYTHTDTQRLGQMYTFTVCAPADTPSSGGKVANFKRLDTYNHFSPLLLPFFRPLPFFSCLTCQATEKNSFTLKRGTICRSGEKILFWLKVPLWEILTWLLRRQINYD